MSIRLRYAWALAALFVSCSSNGGGTSSAQCTNDSSCPVGAYCRIAQGGSTGQCACKTDDACPTGETCNSQGICQKKTACRSNAECDASKFCDILSGACLDRTACGADFHCELGSVCNIQGTSGQCVEGCFTTADCPLFSICDKTSAGSNGMGRCLANECEDKTFCKFGENCVDHTCMRDTNPIRCAACNPQQLGSCGSTHNYCLVNSAYSPSNPAAGPQDFCGVECTMESDCPNWYTCEGVILLTQDQCTSDAQCGGGGRVCVIGEADLKGFCTCVQDAECVPAMGICVDLGLGKTCANNPGTPCASDVDCLCQPQTMTCAGTGRPCMRGSDCVPKCVFDSSNRGGCFLGMACAPEDGLYCPQLTQ